MDAGGDNMALRRPPQHRVDAPIVFIHPADDAWDKETIEAEAKKMEEAGESPSQHPYAQYAGGHGRYDLDAVYTVCGEAKRPRDYLLPDKKPTEWHLKRLWWNDWYDVQAEWEAEIRRKRDPKLAYLKALAVGIQKVENGPKLQGPPNRLTTDDMDKIFALRFERDGVTVEPAIDIGEAVYTASLPLTDAEGKR